MDEEIAVRDDAVEIDLRDRLRFAADALAADFSGSLTVDHAEALVFSSAEGLLATASITEFVPILAERRARLVLRSGALPSGPIVAAAPPPPAPQAPTPRTTPPVLAVAVEHLDRLRDRVDLVRVRVADWRAELDQR